MIQSLEQSSTTAIQGFMSDLLSRSFRKNNEIKEHVENNKNDTDSIDVDTDEQDQRKGLLSKSTISIKIVVDNPKSGESAAKWNQIQRQRQHRIEHERMTKINQDRWMSDSSMSPTKGSNNNNNSSKSSRGGKKITIHGRQSKYSHEQQNGQDAVSTLADYNSVPSRRRRSSLDSHCKLPVRKPFLAHQSMKRSMSVDHVASSLSSSTEYGDKIVEKSPMPTILSPASTSEVPPSLPLPPLIIPFQESTAASEQNHSDQTNYNLVEEEEDDFFFVDTENI